MKKLTKIKAMALLFTPDTDGDEGSNLLYGGAGDDTINGFGGNDNLHGQAGSDVLYGGAGRDMLAGGGDADAMFGGAGNDALWGDAGADSLSGAAGNDWLNGGTGDDTINGGTGADWLFGNDGADTFAFNAAQQDGDADEIVGFEAADRVVLDVANPGAFAFQIGGIPSPTVDTFVLRSGVLWFDPAGADPAIRIATVGSTLTAGQLDLI